MFCSSPPPCTLLAMTVAPPCYPENHVIPPSFFLLPPSPMINNDRCFTFNFPLSRKKQSSSAQRTCLQHFVSGKLSLFLHFFWLLLFLFLFLWFFLFLFLFCFFFLLCSLDAISSKFSESSEEDDEAIEAMVEIDKFEDSLRQKEIIKPE